MSVVIQYEDILKMVKSNYLISFSKEQIAMPVK